MNRAAKLMEVEVGELEVLEEYEPDTQDLEDFQKAENLPELPKSDEVTLYLVRIAFAHYVKRAQEFTQGLIERFAPGSKAEAIRFRNLIIIRLDVPEASILIGKQGATLDALQHVVVRCLLTEDEDFPDVMLDIENYREKKLVRLEREARLAADRATRTGRKVPLSPMSPAERKFIHNCLKEMEGIRTESRGEDRGRERHVRRGRRGQESDRRPAGQRAEHDGRHERDARAGRGRLRRRAEARRTAHEEQGQRHVELR
ncbi:MAG TPA: R3H domain-containing nucleic acid-binding protein, partial [Candidatus Sumerlaeota bacterium]|nr:R3H domain-containing nucleic acid-binding protein [Candidatus Sumerlaeota bacterium]